MPADAVATRDHSRKVSVPVMAAYGTGDITDAVARQLFDVPAVGERAHLPASPGRALVSGQHLALAG